jgi:hypothetical protein
VTVQDKVDVTSPGVASSRRWGTGVSATGKSWVAGLKGGLDKVAPAVAISEYDYKVSAPPRWKVEKTDGGFVVVDELTGVFGSGADANSAIQDVFAALHEHRDVLERQDALSPALEEQLRYLRELL